MKAVPRWCTDMKLLNRVVIYQSTSGTDDGGLTPDDVFGKLDPRRLEFNLRELFGDPNIRSFRKQQRFDRRGSSAIWNDGHEFATPIEGGCK